MNFLFILQALIFTGAFVPLTKAGSIVVDGILASCYSDFDHDLAHLSMAPIQWFPNIIKWRCGEDRGFSVFVSMAKEFGTYMLPDRQFLSAR